MTFKIYGKVYFALVQEMKRQVPGIHREELNQKVK